MFPRENPEVPNSKDKDLARLIAELADAEFGIRETAASELFARGLARAARVLADWLGDQEIANCFVFENPQAELKFPRTTVGIAVEPDTFDRIYRASGSPRLADVPPDLDAKEFELRPREGVRLDILTTRDAHGGGAIGRFLEKQGAGIQQVELEVSDVDRATRLFQAHLGIEPLYSGSRTGADGTRVNFFLVASREGGKLLVELVQVKP